MENLRGIFFLDGVSIIYNIYCTIGIKVMIITKFLDHSVIPLIRY